MSNDPRPAADDKPAPRRAETPAPSAAAKAWPAGKALDAAMDVARRLARTNR